jgi:hypothetical protein
VDEGPGGYGCDSCSCYCCGNSRRRCNNSRRYGGDFGKGTARTFTIA